MWYIDEHRQLGVLMDGVMAAGPCQGRQCRNVVTALIGEVHHIPMAEVGDYRARPPLKPITLGQLAGEN